MKFIWRLTLTVKGKLLPGTWNRKLKRLPKNRPKFIASTFNEITKTAVTNAIEHPLHIDMQKVAAQQARRVLDRWVGYEVSPILWKKLPKGLSAGRVQSVALRLICDREDAIRAFKPEEYWSIEGIFKHADGLIIAPLTHIAKKKIEISNKKASP